MDRVVHFDHLQSFVFLTSMGRGGGSFRQRSMALAIYYTVEVLGSGRLPGGYGRCMEQLSAIVGGDQRRPVGIG